MTRHRPQRVAIAVKPTILGDALETILRSSGIDEVVNLHDDPASGGGVYDAAVVTIVLPDGVDADVVVELPADATGNGTVTVRSHGVAHPVQIDNIGDIVRLLNDATE